MFEIRHAQSIDGDVDRLRLVLSSQELSDDLKIEKEQLENLGARVQFWEDKSDIYSVYFSPDRLRTKVDAGLEHLKGLTSLGVLICFLYAPIFGRKETVDRIQDRMIRAAKLDVQLYEEVDAFCGAKPTGDLPSQQGSRSCPSTFGACSQG